MDQSESSSVSFIIKIWLEEVAEESDHATWRGHITHVPSGERRYLQDLNGITIFIAPYLEVMGVKLNMCWRLKRWLSLRRQHPKTHV